MTPVAMRWISLVFSSDDILGQLGVMCFTFNMLILFCATKALLGDWCTIALSEMTLAFANMSFMLYLRCRLQETLANLKCELPLEPVVDEKILQLNQVWRAAHWIAWRDTWVKIYVFFSAVAWLLCVCCTSPDTPVWIVVAGSLNISYGSIALAYLLGRVSLVSDMVEPAAVGNALYLAGGTGWHPEYEAPAYEALL
eukprot:CAMPEP_0206584396 /NCGR_PEP_ID=MMETSP0325_2-20121206/35694_1 /ASSEMBLY_ACC=CAM_ASM_000347 /TAXON_ID=2866 /ORGANISM="Crypthecodinium cohnii, Strain Seligo" /LENGTH=196 /DNA_ID=CAMNT_0054091539 /DNA_START=8 /DNA_END=598 /DNA_ORIENTATION=-